jgi:dGTPase
MTAIPYVLLTRLDQERYERDLLAPYATLAAQAGRRLHPEPEHEFRTGFQRDRDRIIHSVAFRRLEYKTQVFLFHEGDHYRTRLTHTLEVAQIARTLARILRVNTDLTEAHALAHDLGHPPFGHAGERVLNYIMADWGGFEHNAQALRIVDYLERKYPQFHGLNLTPETRRSILKQKPPYENQGQGMAASLPLEAQIVDIADEISYTTHDLDDGIESGFLPAEVIREVPMWRDALEQVTQEIPGMDEKRTRYQIIVRLINQQVMDAASETLRRLNENLGVVTETTVDYSADMKRKVQETKDFLRDHLYRHPAVLRMNTRSKIIIESLFTAYCEDPRLLPKSFFQRIDSDGLQRTAADYVSGMTDRYAEQDYKDLFGF